MAEPLVSIIMPVYNTDKYVSKAIESVLGQTYHNLELIIVNDGSTDESVNICNDYAKIDNRIVLIHQNNNGVASARNVGLSAAKGEFVQFIDSDDEMHKKKTELLLKLMCENDVDIVFCGYYISGVYNITIDANKKTYEVNDFLFCSYGDKVLKNIISSSCMCIYKRRIIAENLIRFNDIFTVGEDGLFILNYLASCKNVYVSNEVLYYYNTYEQKDRVSITSCVTTNIYLLVIKYYEELLRIVQHSLTVGQKNILAKHFFNRLIPSLIILVAYSDSSLIKLLKELKNIIFNPVVHQASLRYKRINKKHSLLIPIFIKKKMAILLYLALKNRIKNFFEVYGKNEYVNSIYYIERGDKLLI